MNYFIVGDTPMEKERVLCNCGDDLTLAEHILFSMTHFISGIERDIVAGYENLKILKSN